MKIGDVLYNFNFTPQYTMGTFNRNVSISKYVGKFAEQNTFFLRDNGTLVCGGAGGKVYEFDQSTFDDDGDSIRTVYKTAWLRPLQEDQKTVDMKQGNWIKPVFETDAAVTYTITAEGDFEQISDDSITVTLSDGVAIPNQVVGTFVIGSSNLVDTKLPLRWRGEQMKLTIEADDTLGPDKIAQFTIYGAIHGRE